MPIDALSMYQRYLGMQGTRSLARLAEDETAPSLSTLKRWSIRYDWRALVSAHDQVTAQQIMTDLVNRSTTASSDFLTVGIHSFLKLIELEGSEPTERDTRRIFNPSVLDFCRLIRLERELRRDLKPQ
jgi:hypothetical protein